MRIARVESRVPTYSPEYAADSCSRRIEPRPRRKAPRWWRGDGVLAAAPASGKGGGGGSVHDGHVDGEVRGEFERAWERFMIVEREALPRFSCAQPQPEIYD